jgi:hypothetical protein
VYLRLYEVMLDALPELLGAYSDEGVLSALDAAAPDTWHVFGQ